MKKELQNLKYFIEILGKLDPKAQQHFIDNLKNTRPELYEQVKEIR